MNLKVPANTLSDAALMISIKPEGLNQMIEKIRLHLGTDTIIIVFGGETDSIAGSGYCVTNRQNRIRLIEKLAKMTGISRMIDDFLDDAGFLGHLTGRRYIKDAVELILSNGHGQSMPLKEIYGVIAEKFSTTAKKVERAIRRSVETTSTKKGRNIPTNSKFLRSMAEIIRLSTGLN